MRRSLLGLAVGVSLAQAALAQQYLPSGGFNGDGVGESLPISASTNVSLDASGYAMYVAGVNASGGAGLPASGTVGVHQLQPYSASNVLKVVSGTAQELTLDTPAALSELRFLGFATNGELTAMDVTIHFTDGSTEAFNPSVADWYYPAASSSIALQGFGRVGRFSNSFETPPSQPMLYDTALPIGCANRSKSVRAVSFSHAQPGRQLIVLSLAGTAYSPDGSHTLAPGQTLQLTGTPAGGSWQSSAAGVASVSSTGSVQALGTGTSTVSYTAAGTCLSYTIQVDPRAAQAVPASSHAGLSVLALLAVAGAGLALRRRQSV